MEIDLPDDASLPPGPTVLSPATPHLEAEIAHLLALPPARRRAVTSPLLDRALALIATKLPASEAQIADHLIKARLASERIELAQLERASRFSPSRPPFAVLRRPGLVVVLRQDQLPVALTVHHLAVRAMVNFGVARIAQIAFRAGAEDPSLVNTVVTAKEGFRWLDQALGWFWFQSQSSPLVARIDDILQGIGEVSLDHLWQALFRAWPPDHIPSPRALRTLCTQVPRFRVARQTVAATERTAPAQAPRAESDQVVLRLFRRFGPQIEGSRLQEISQHLGVASARLSRYLRSSPFVLEPRPGLFRLIGS